MWKGYLEAGVWSQQVFHSISFVKHQGMLSAAWEQSSSLLETLSSPSAIHGSTVKWVPGISMVVFGGVKKSRAVMPLFQAVGI